MSPTATRVVLRDTVGRDDLDAAARRWGWLLANVAPKSDSRPFQIVFLTADERTAVHFVHDERLDARYLALHGADVARAEREVRETLPTYDEADVRRMIERPMSRQEQIRGLGYLRLLAPSGLSRESAASMIQHVLARGEPEAKLAALDTAAASGVVEHVIDAVRRTKNDRDRDVRARAAEVLDTWSRRGTAAAEPRGER